MIFLRLHEDYVFGSKIALPDFIPRKFTVVWVDVGKNNRMDSSDLLKQAYFPTSTQTSVNLRGMKSGNISGFLYSS